MSQFQTVGVLAHPKRPQTIPVAQDIVRSLDEHGMQTWRYDTWDEDDVTESVQQSDLVVAIGGDGAMLKAARVCAPYGVPVLGVNMGRLGFLTEINELEDWRKYVDRLLNGDYWVEKRMMIRARVAQDETVHHSGIALNEVFIGGNGSASMIQLDTYIDGDWATTYNADALIISTPTGSTAYALAVGGPILPPDLSNILLVPSAPHLSMDRPIVLSEGSRVAVRASQDNRNDILVRVDGMLLTKLDDRFTLHVNAAEYSSLFVRMRQRNYFYRSLLDRLEPRVNRSAPEHMKTLNVIDKTPNA